MRRMDAGLIGPHSGSATAPRGVEGTDDSLAPGVVVPEAPAGSVVLFSEALTHGTAPWKGAHQRRTLLYKYCQSHLAWSARRVRPPASVPLTPRQQLLFQEPANPGTWTSSLFAETAANSA